MLLVMAFALASGGCGGGGGDDDSSGGNPYVPPIEEPTDPNDPNDPEEPSNPDNPSPDVPVTNGNWIDVADTSWYTDNPATKSYTISSAAQLAGLAKLANDGNVFLDKTITLADDIDLAGRRWTPIASYAYGGSILDYNFQGTFDGGGHTISNMTVVGSSDFRAGLFGHIFLNGTVKGVILSDVYVSSSSSETSYAGGIASHNYGIIENCASSGLIYSFDIAGGIAAYNNTGTIRSCTSSCSVSSVASSYSSYAGGIVGINFGGTIWNCTSNGSVYASSEHAEYSESAAGGIIGMSEAAEDGVLWICTSRVTEVTAVNIEGGDAYSGGFIGININTGLIGSGNRNESGVKPDIGYDYNTDGPIENLNG
jgi:hypothetical protein